MIKKTIQEAGTLTSDRTAPTVKDTEKTYPPKPRPFAGKLG